MDDMSEDEAESAAAEEFDLEPAEAHGFPDCRAAFTTRMGLARQECLSKQKYGKSGTGKARNLPCAQDFRWLARECNVY